MKRHLPALDGLRGLAALSVVLYHLGHWMNAPWLATNSGLSVDLFFCLSGFVLPLAYWSRRKNISIVDFFMIRAIRLAPLIILGAVVSFIYVMLKIKMTHLNIQPSIILAALIGAIFSIPTFGAPMTLGGPQVFPLNGPQYTLFLEFIANAVWWAFRNVAQPLLIVAIIILVSSVLVALFGLGGDTAQTFFQGFPRVALSFALGLTIYHVSMKYQPIKFFNQVLFGVAGVITVALFYCPTHLPLWGELAWILFVSPALVFSGSHIALPGGYARASLWLGQISYPIYALHYPIFCWVNGILRSKIGAQNFAIEAPSTLVFTLALSWAALLLYDNPIRRRLNYSINVGRSKRSEQAAHKT